MPTYFPCKKNDTNGYIFYVSFISQANTKIFQANPTLAAGDVKIAIDDGAPANLGTLPAVDADFTKRVKVTLSQAETNGDNLTIIFSDAAGAEWCDLTLNIHTSAANLEDIEGQTDDIGIAGAGLTALPTVTVGTNNDKTGYALSVAGIDNILDEICETQGNYTLRQVASIILSVLAGVTSNNGATLKTPNGIATRVNATIDANNNRTAMSLTP